MATSTKRVIVNQRNFTYSRKHKIKPTGELLTVPDDSFSISEILEKFTRGVDPMLTRNPIDFDAEPNIDDNIWNLSDLTDIDSAKDWLEDINTKKKLLSDHIKKLEKDKKDKVDDK